MAHIDEFFPSKYLKAADLAGGEFKISMKGIVVEELENDHGTESKPVLYFHGTDKGLVLNKTNAHAIADSHGYNYTEWDDRQITLFEAMVDAFGKTVPAIRVKVTPENMQRSSNGTPVEDRAIEVVPPEQDAPTPEDSGNTSSGKDDLPFAWGVIGLAPLLGYSAHLIG